MSDKIEAEILDALGEEVDAAVDTPLVVIEGPKGDPGAPGKDGHSPVVTATKSGKTTTISVDGEAIATVEDGADGAPGKDGADGSNGKDGKPGEKGADGTPGIYYGTTPPTGDTHPVWIDPNGDHDDGGLLPAVNAADNGKVLRVVNSAWSAEDMPEALPNPNALTFTGAVTGSYDGSAPLSVEIPSGGGSGSDISLGLTGAAAGQIAKITSVDDTGKPTAWEAVDMPTGGNSEDMRVIKTITITADGVNSIYFNRDDNGLPFALTKRIRIRMYGAATNTGSTQAALFFRAGQTIGDKPQSNYPIKVNSNNANYIFDFVWDLYSAVNCWYGDFSSARACTENLRRFVPSGGNNSSDITVREIKLVWSNASVFFQNGATIVVEGI